MCQRPDRLNLDDGRETKVDAMRIKIGLAAYKLWAATNNLPR